MSKAIAVVEGSTEQTFIREVLAPWLWEENRIELVASAAGKPGKKGGNRYGKVRRDIINHLKNPHFVMVTTFFDFYGMPPDWPGRKEARKKALKNKPSTVEQAIRKDIEPDVGKDLARKLLPYIQMHEFEALLFTDPTAITQVTRQENCADELLAVLEEFNTPEEINDSPRSAPSKRIEAVIPFYRKPLHGVLAAKEITIEKMRSACPHFNEWVKALGAIGKREER